MLGEKQMNDFKFLCITLAPTKNCENDETYGAVCVRCNKCGRFDVNKKELEEK